MKKDYIVPEIDLVVSHSRDIITESDPVSSEIGSSMSLNGNIQPDGWT